jgi:hypothetical protein
VAKAWGAASPWHRAVERLLPAYTVDAAAAQELPGAAFHTYCANKAMDYLRRYWEAPPSRRAGAVLGRYREAYGLGSTTATRACPRPYTLALTEDRPSLQQGLGAELCMQLRAECLPLRAMHATDRPRETAAARHLRELCPSCGQARETPAHFMLDCPVYAAARRELFAALQVEGLLSPAAGRRAGAGDAAAPELRPLELLNLPQDLAWRALVGPDYLERGAGGQLVAAYVAAAWSIRRAALAGREANGGNPMALPPVPGANVAAADH